MQTFGRCKQRVLPCKSTIPDILIQLLQSELDRGAGCRQLGLNPRSRKTSRFPRQLSQWTSLQSYHSDAMNGQLRRPYLVGNRFGKSDRYAIALG